MDKKKSTNMGSKEKVVMVSLKEFDKVIENYHPIIFLKPFIQSSPLSSEEARRVVEANIVTRLELKASVLVLHTK